MKFLLLVLLFVSSVASACDSYMIGFRGQGGVFNQKAFLQYALKRSDCVKVFNFTDINQAIVFINKLDVPYSLYGFSAGASSIRRVLAKVNKKPKYIITVGALYSTNVDFTATGIPFDNFFDDSGRGNKGPGTHIRISHGQIQQYVADLYN